MRMLRPCSVVVFSSVARFAFSVASFTFAVVCCRSCASLVSAASFSSALYVRDLTFGASTHPLLPSICHLSVVWSGVGAVLVLAVLIHPEAPPASMAFLSPIHHFLSMPW